LRQLSKLRKQGASVFGPFQPEPAGFLDVGNAEWEREAALCRDIPPAPPGWGIEPDFQPEDKLRFVHRRTPNADFYFVSNPSDQEMTIDLRFRITGRRGELWDPLTGRITKLETRADEFVTVVPHRFPAGGSAFFAFVDEPSVLARPAGRTVSRGELKVEGPWRLSFQPDRGAPEEVTLDRLQPWPELADEGVRHFSGVATYTKTIEVPSGVNEALLDLGEVFDMAEVVVNGKPAGIVWTPPFVIEVGDLLVPGKNTIEIRVANRWINRLIGDEKLPPDAKYSGNEVSAITRGVLLEFPAWWGQSSPRRERVGFATWRHYDGSEELVPSGLVGPVVLQWEL
jgi:hypothetical protein